MAQWVPLVWITMILKTQIPSYLNYKASFGFCQSFPKDKKKKKILQILLSTQGWNFELWRWRISESKKPTQPSGSWWSVLWNWNKRQGSTLLQVIQVCSYWCSRLMLVNWLILHINYTVNEENSHFFTVQLLLCQSPLFVITVFDAGATTLHHLLVAVPMGFIRASIGFTLKSLLCQTRPAAPAMSLD